MSSKLVLSFAPRGFSLERAFWFSPLLKNQQLQIRRRTTLWMCFLQIIIIHYLFHQSKKARENSFSSSSFSFPDTFISPASQLSSSSNNRRKILHLKHFKFFPLNLSPRVHFFAGSWIQRADGPNEAGGVSLWKQGVGVVGGLGLGSHCTEKDPMTSL